MIAISNVLISVYSYSITISSNEIHEILLLGVVSGLKISSWLIHFKILSNKCHALRRFAVALYFPRDRLCLCICIFTLIYFRYHWNRLLSSLHFPRKQFLNIHFHTRFTNSSFRQRSRSFLCRDSSWSALVCFLHKIIRTLQFQFQPLRFRFLPAFFSSRLFSSQTRRCLLLRQLLFSSRASSVYK